MFCKESMDAKVMAHVHGLFFVGCLENMKCVYRGLADAFGMKCKYAVREMGMHVVVYLERRVVCLCDERW